MCLEVLGVGMILPLIETIVRPEWVDEFPLLKFYSEKLGDENFFFMILVFVVVLFFVKNLFLAFQVHLYSKYSFDVQVEISNFLFKSYLKRPYDFFLKSNSSELIRNTVVEVNTYIGYILQPSLILVSESLVLLAIVVLLLTVQPFVFLLVFILVALVGWSFNNFTSKRVSEWGIQRQSHEGKKIQSLQEGFSGIKFIKLLGDYSLLTRRFKRHTKLGSIAGRNQYSMQQMPKLLLEFLGVLAISGLALSLYLDSPNDKSSIPKLGMVAFGMIRIIPSIARIVNAYQSLIYGSPSLSILLKELNNWSNQKDALPNTKNKTFEKSYEIKEVSYTYPGEVKDSLSNVSISIEKGSFVGIVGESGSGKSTLIDIALGLLKPNKGSILLDGKTLSEDLKDISLLNIGYVPQEIFLNDDTLKSNVAFGEEVEIIDEDKVWKCLDDANLADFIRELPTGLNTKMGEKGVRFSGGQKQRVGIARALYNDPDLIVFDEATSALDSKTESSIMKTIYSLKNNKTCVIVTHRHSTLHHCDKVYKMKNGRVVESGTYEKLL